MPRFWSREGSIEDSFERPLDGLRIEVGTHVILPMGNRRVFLPHVMYEEVFLTVDELAQLFEQYLNNDAFLTAYAEKIAHLLFLAGGPHDLCVKDIAEIEGAPTRFYVLGQTLSVEGYFDVLYGAFGTGYGSQRIRLPAVTRRVLDHALVRLTGHGATHEWRPIGPSRQ